MIKITMRIYDNNGKWNHGQRNKESNHRNWGKLRQDHSNSIAK